MLVRLSEIKKDFEYPDAVVCKINDKDVFVKQYLPASQKYQLVYGCAQVLDLANMPYNPFFAKVVFETEVVRNYSSLSFDTDDDIFKLYDILDVNGIFTLIINSIPIAEYEELQNLFDETVDAHIQHHQSILSAIDRFMGAMTNTENFDLDLDTIKTATEMVSNLQKNQHI